MGKKRRQKGNVPPLTQGELAQEQEQAQAARECAKRIKIMEQQIRFFHKKRYPEKPLDYILVKIEGEFGSLGALIAIIMIKRNQWEKLTLERRIAVETEKARLLQGRPDLKECLGDCPCQR